MSKEHSEALNRQKINNTMDNRNKNINDPQDKQHNEQ